MTESKSSLPWWPFLVADALFVALAALLLQQAHKPLVWWEAMLLIICVAAGAACCLIPLLRRNQDEQALAQARLLADALRQIQNINEVAAQVVGATTQWREFKQHTEEISASNKTLAESVSAEVKAFSAFMQKANDAEKAHLRLEIEKLHRGEMEWLHVLILILDRVSALYQAAQQTGQPGLIEEVGQFHHSCREIARRVGLVAVAGREGEVFDPNQHQLRDKSVPPESAAIGETLAPGYTFQGKLVRRPLVALKEPAVA